MDFHKISLQDKEWVEQLLSWSDYNSCEYSFSSLLNWSHIHQTEVCRMGDFGIVRSGFKEFSYLYPFGRGDEMCIRDSHRRWKIQCDNAH